MIGALITFLIYVIIIGLILWLIDYVAQMLPLPPPFAQVIRVVIAVIGVLLILYLLLGLLGMVEVPRLGRL